MLLDYALLIEPAEIELEANFTPIKVRVQPVLTCQLSVPDDTPKAQIETIDAVMCAKGYTRV